jgi:hypothetical protein
MRIFRSVVVALVLLLSAAAVEFKPYPTAPITEDQWASYYEQVKTAHGASMREFREQNLVIFEDRVTRLSYAFTQPGHPAWIARQPVQAGENISIEQIGYFAGSEASFANFFRQYLALNKRIKEELNRRRAK